MIRIITYLVQIKPKRGEASGTIKINNNKRNHIMNRMITKIVQCNLGRGKADYKINKGKTNVSCQIKYNLLINHLFKV